MRLERSTYLLLRLILWSNRPAPILLSVFSAVVLVRSEALKGHSNQSCFPCQPQGYVPPHYAKINDLWLSSFIDMCAIIMGYNNAQKWTPMEQGHSFDFLLGPVHTNPFSDENGAVLLRIRLSSTLQRRKRSPKTEPFENALQSGAIWKRCFLKTLFSSVDGENDAIWKRWRHQNRHDRAPDHLTVSIQNGGQTLTCVFNFAPISRADRHWNAHASSSFEHAHWGYKSVFKTDTAL